MFRTVALGVFESPIQSGGVLQLVRWRRKPRWLPMAKSKLFRVPERPSQDPMERTELMRLHAHYKTQLRAVRGFLMTDTNAREATSTADHLIISPEQMEAEFQQCAEINNKWNAEISLIRNSRLQLERDDQHQQIQQRLMAKDERIATRRTAAEELVRIEKERSKALITADNIDEAIEKALADTVDFNFAIDLGGKIYRSDP